MIPLRAQPHPDPRARLGRHALNIEKTRHSPLGLAANALRYVRRSRPVHARGPIPIQIHLHSRSVFTARFCRTPSHRLAHLIAVSQQRFVCRRVHASCVGESACANCPQKPKAELASIARPCGLKHDSCCCRRIGSSLPACDDLTFLIEVRLLGVLDLVSLLVTHHLL